MQRVIAVMPTRYDDIWTAAKGGYKTEPAIADGGEVVALARVRGGAVREVDGVRRVECDRAVVRFDRGVKVLRGHLRVARLLRHLGLRLVLGRGAHG